MATYKVIQDIEAEDKLVGPLTLKQFIYAGISALCLYICFIAMLSSFSLKRRRCMVLLLFKINSSIFETLQSLHYCIAAYGISFVTSLE